jgi:biopolymer transport protein ExbD
VHEDGTPPPSWTLEVDRDGWTLRAPDGAGLAATRATLTTLLRARAVGDPLTVRAQDGVAYATVVEALDGARSAGIRVVALTGADE